MNLSTYDDFAVRWRESELKSAIRKLFEKREQPVFQLPEILDMMSAVPARAISGLLSDIVGNQSFRLTISGVDGYIVYRNGYYMFQPDYLSDVRIPLALRVAEVPVKRDSYAPAQIKVAPLPKAQVAEAPPQEAEEVAEPPKEGTLASYWRAIKEWAIAIASAKADLADVPFAVQKAISERYVGDAQSRENDQLIVVNWLFEHIKTSTVYTKEKKEEYLVALSSSLLEMVWDESIRPNEQLELLLAKDSLATISAGEQIVTKGDRSAIRIIDITTDTLKYFCGKEPCLDTVSRIFETNPDDPLNKLQANIETAGGIYGFIVPKGKEGRLVFKTNERPVQPGTKPEKGGECSIVSTIAFHVRMLKDISDLMAAEGYPRLILTEEYLDERVRIKAAKKAAKEAAEEAKKAGRKYEPGPAEPAEPVRTGEFARKGKQPFKTRQFENAIRACALKDIILRWIDYLQRKKGGKRFFFRPVAALKTGHKGSK
jgi:hypothetical protein